MKGDMIMDNKGKGRMIMKIQRIAIDGFKNLNKVNITFSPITALIALNNFGKSNVLAGIDYGLNFINANSDKRKNWMSSENNIPINIALVDKQFSFEIEATTSINSKKYRVIYGFSYDWVKTDEDIFNINTEYLKAKIDDKGQKYSTLISRQGDKAFYKSSETGRCTTKTQIDNIELVVNKLKAFDQLYYIELIKRLNELNFYMENNLDVKDFYMPNPIISKSLGESYINSDNLPRVIARLKQIAPDKFDLLLDAYKQLFPSVEDVILKEIKINEKGDIVIPEDAPFIVSNTIYLLFVKNKTLSKLIHFEAMSDGAKRVFMIMTKIIMANIGGMPISLIAIEEPENSIHPSLFKAYLQIITDLLEDCKVIITSHSPYVVSFLELSNIYVGVHKDGGYAEFYGFKKNKEKSLMDDANTVDMSMGDYIFSMLSDDESEIDTYLECGVDE